MAVGARLAGVLPLAGATLAAVALGGVAVFTVQAAGCGDPGQYVQRDDGQVELMGSCVDPEHLPPAQEEPQTYESDPALNELSRPGQLDQAP
ncbi:hypothetical protein [Actinophytocola sp.]|uniref:hypothetical protein n=1 Tax=Actinophytocola sp. TaxID=1872138 RepID=UPI002ED49160